jgi:hypothetical protein
MRKHVLLAVLAVIVVASGTTHAQKPNVHVELHNPVKFDAGEEAADQTHGQEVSAEHRSLLGRPTQSQSNNRPDGALQGGSGPLVNTVDGAGFDGVAANGSAPPDPNLAVGPNDVVQWVNTRYAIYDKAGNIRSGYPKAGNNFWSGFGGACQSQNSGDPIIQYDAVADRWIASQFTSTKDANQAYYQCLAISQTSDPGGAYFRYAYAFTDGFPDYPKITVWKNAYFASYNMFMSTAGGWIGPRICAYDRAAMLAGASAVQECFTITSGNYGSLEPSDLDGGSAFAPPSNTGYFLDFGNNSLALWRFTPDFVTPLNATLDGPISLPAASFSPACGGGTCIPQPSGQNLDSLADRLMYRLAYRNFGDHEAMVVNQSVTPTGSPSVSGIRWYEIRNPLTNPTIFQQGTYAPDSAARWMGSAAMDDVGNIAIGYSASSSSLRPSIRYTGRETGDPLNTLQAEMNIITGGGSQTAGLSRWGDYSAIRVDPADDCTFWYTSEYIPSDGTFNWHTRIASFKFNSCGSAPAPDFTIGATPASQTVVQGAATNYSVSVGALNGFNSSVVLSVSGLPAGATPTFTPPSITGSGSSNLNVTTLGSTPAGTYTLTITGTSGSSHSTTVTLVVQASGPPPPAPDFSLTANPPTSQTISARQSATYTITVNQLNGFNSAVTFSVSGLPSRTSASFSPTSSTTGTTLTVRANFNARRTNPTTLTITGTSGTLKHTATVTLTIQ